jgi:hypothetical protein
LQLIFVDATDPHNQLHMTSRSRRIKVKRQLLEDIEAAEALSYTIN